MKFFKAVSSFLNYAISGLAFCAVFGVALGVLYYAIYGIILGFAHVLMLLKILGIIFGTLAFFASVGYGIDKALTKWSEKPGTY